MFFQQLEKFGNSTAVIYPDGELSYQALADQVEGFKARLPTEKQLVVLQADNNLQTLVAYLACLQAGHCILLVPDEIEQHAWQQLLKDFRPNLAIRKLKIDNLNQHLHQIGEMCHLLLSTSGSTGKAKHVVLSTDNLHSNAQAICCYLPIKKTDRALVTLPFFYSYGLSVINSHLASGACLVFTSFSVVQKAWWQQLEDLKISSIAGVPHSYEMLLRLRFTEKALPDLRYFTQAGGRLDKEKVVALAEYAERFNKQFYVMYGQTEATARMAFLDPSKAKTKPQSIGKAIPGGKITLQSLEPQNDECDLLLGELIYSGPNVMQGYATCAEELQNMSPIENLATGDIGYVDQDGDFYITGRVKRFLKIFGVRIGLDEAEHTLKSLGLDCYCCGNDDKLVVATTDTREDAELKPLLSHQFQLHPSAIQILKVDTLPINSRGKKDYQSVMAMSGLQ